MCSSSPTPVVRSFSAGRLAELIILLECHFILTHIKRSIEPYGVYRLFITKSRFASHLESSGFYQKKVFADGGPQLHKFHFNSFSTVDIYLLSLIRVSGLPDLHVLISCINITDSYGGDSAMQTANINARSGRLGLNRYVSPIKKFKRGSFTPGNRYLYSFRLVSRSGCMRRVSTNPHIFK